MADTIVVKNEPFDLYIEEDRIQARIKELATQINRDFQGKVPIFIGVLNGSFIFFADLIREITVDCEIDFIKLSSYGDAKISSGQVRMVKELNCQVAGRDIIMVEDIVDTGLSVEYLRKHILQEKPASLRFVTLLLKKDVARVQQPIDYVGFEIPPEFVIGYGLDYGQKLRNLKAVYRQRPVT
ncbi:MAG: hypoxanthine phosphoribosyltransferase [Ignavibacteria bacterium GWA2_55_11]|nr:MAG: hypoxanthine phosphoribosyltransferase [Ignavibacteria bacterium GWA2_55_11]OGU44127.1 MAG: hypoxanthine phosphoribosyltransferase [Ignavibacteria bacterium GWC2_56_12]HAV23324.1 hypoxanthine phosphoribosyltransferase [Bacteroidota bacterium]